LWVGHPFHKNRFASGRRRKARLVAKQIRDRGAELLEALTRHVIVFTHDLLFLKVLREEAETRGVPVEYQYVRLGPDETGLVSPDLPWVAMPTNRRIGVLRQRWQAAEKRFREGDGRDAREIFTMLPEA
jgi:hypothetical protein